jgi:hypothetical protein
MRFRNRHFDSCYQVYVAPCYGGDRLSRSFEPSIRLTQKRTFHDAGPIDLTANHRPRRLFFWPDAIHGALLQSTGTETRPKARRSTGGAT